MNTYKVAIVEDHSVVIEGLTLALKIHSKIELVQAFQEASLLIEYLKNHSLDVVIVDIGISNMDGIKLLEVLKQKNPEIKVIIFTMHTENHFFAMAKNLNVDAYVLKTERTTFLATVIMKVIKGERYYSDHSNFLLMKSNVDYDLSKMQASILDLLSQGKSRLEIANILDVSCKTVSYHIAKLKRFTDVNNRIELLKFLKEKNTI